MSPPAKVDAKRPITLTEFLALTKGEQRLYNRLHALGRIELRAGPKVRKRMSGMSYGQLMIAAFGGRNVWIAEQMAHKVYASMEPEKYGPGKLIAG